MLVDTAAYLLSMIWVLAGAALLIILLPLYVWRNYLKNKSYTYRFVFAVLVQNSFLINLVLLLGFLGICNRWTVLLGMAAFFIPIGWHFSDKQFFYRWQRRLNGLEQVLHGKKRFFTLRQEIGFVILKNWQGVKSWSLWRHIRRNLLEYLFLLGAVAYNTWFFSYNVIANFHSYQFSDIPVHQAWIHALGQGTLFVDGIYPFGMHAIIYLIHQLFCLDLREVLLYFGIFQIILLMLSIHLLARALLRWKYGAFVATISFSLLLNQGRYAASLPQECGVFAMVLAGWCLVHFFQTPLERQFIKGDSRLRRFFRVKQYLNRRYLNTTILLFMLAVALCIDYHFYTAIAACMLVLSFFAGYFFRVVKKQYWVPVITTGILGVLIAVGPLLVCYAQGIPFQESMAWAMSVIHGEEWAGSDPDYQEQLEDFWGAGHAEEGGGEAQTGEAQDAWPGIHGKPFAEKFPFYYYALYDFARINMFGDELTGILVVCFALGAVFGGLQLFSRQRRLAGAGYLTILLYVMIIGTMGAAQTLGITDVIGPARAMSFTEPFLGIVYALPLDFIFLFLGRYKNHIYQRVLVLAAVALCAGLVFIIFHRGWVHDFFDANPAYYNEPDYLVKHIRKTYDPWTFTIISPVEEYYQVVDYGYHENISKFVNMASSQEEEYKIPTPYVFLFIEKKVLDDYYYGSAEVSLDYAMKDFIYFGSNQDYYFQRAVLESKAYYWALAFMKIYPNSFKVYFENDIYIAYVLEQNPFHLYNLQIDYLPKGAGE